MINGMKIYYEEIKSQKAENPISNKKSQKAEGLKPS